MLQAAPADRPAHLATIWRAPMALGSPRVDLWPQGLSVAEIVSRAACLPADFATRGVVTIDGEPVPRTMWPHVRPKAGTAAGRTIHVTFHAPVREGGRGGKQILAIVAAIALTFATAGIASAGIPALGIAAGSLGAKLIATSVGIVGSLIISAVTAPPTRGAEPGQADGGATLDPASVSGNVLAPNAAVPRVIGTRRVFPPFASQPVIELVGQDELAEAVHVLAGPHKLRDIRLGETTWDGSSGQSDSGLEIEVREGRPGEPAPSLVRRIGRTDDLGIQMSVHSVDPENQVVFAGSVPVFHGMASIDRPDEVWVHFFSAGLLRQDALTDKLRIPLRIRMRRRGDSAWRHLPELHYMDSTQAQRRLQVKFLFGEAAAGNPIPPPASRGFVEARKWVPEQTLAPGGGGWSADSYFSAGAGGDVYRLGTEDTTNVRNLNLQADQVTVYLDRVSWPAGVYEIEVIRGATFRNALFTSSSYQHNGAIWDFFGSNEGGTVPLTREGLLDTLTLRRAVSVQHRPPVARRDVSLICVRVRNRALGQLSVLASGLVRDLGGYVAPDYMTPPVGPVTIAQEATIPDGTFDKTQNIAFECYVRLPKSPAPWSVLWEDGGAGVGAALYITSSGQMVLRAGSGSPSVQASTADTAILTTPVGADGKVHRIAWDIRINPGRVRLWIDGVQIGEAHTTGGGPLSGSVYAGSDWGGYLRPSTGDGSFAGVASGGAWWSDRASASSLRVWADRLHVLPLTVDPVTAIPNGTFSKSAAIAFECQVRLPTDPASWSVLWEDGGTGWGSSLHINPARNFILRAGSGNPSITSSTWNTVVVSLPIDMLPFDGEVHRVAWDIRVNPGRVRLWIDEVLVGEANTTEGGALGAAVYADADAGGYLRPSSLNAWAVAGIPVVPVNWSAPADAGPLRVWPSWRQHDTSRQSMHVLAPSRNPAPWLLEAMTGSLNADPIPLDVIDLDSILDWRQDCYAKNYTCDMVAEGEGLDALLRIIASCGYARPYQSETWGVIRDRDRSAEAPVQVFSPRNLQAFQWTKAFARLPAGLRVTFHDIAQGDTERQLTVYRSDAVGTDARTEQVTYEGLVDEAKIIDRANFDLAQARYRSTFYDFTAPVEAIRCRRGSLVAVNHDILTRHSGFGRMRDLISVGGNVTAVVLDATVDVKNAPDMLAAANLLAVADMLEVGLRTGIAIRRTDGVVSVHALSNAAGETATLTLAVPVPKEIVAGRSAIDVGCLVVTGTLGREYRRMIVSEIRNGKNLTAQLTLVDEAPEIWEAING